MGSSPSKGTQTGAPKRGRPRRQSTPSESQGNIGSIPGEQQGSLGNGFGSADTLSWPLPPPLLYEPFQMHEAISDRDLEFPPFTPESETPREPLERAEASEKRDEREKSDNTWSQQKDSKIVGSAHVQSQLSTRFSAEYKLLAVDNSQVLIDRIRRTQDDLDRNLQARLKKISEVAEKQIGMVMNEMQADEKRLLIYDKKRQEKQDELYGEWLQKYVVKLNEWRSKELFNLQNELLKYQRQIIRRSQDKIAAINYSASSLKTAILDEEKNRATRRTEHLTQEMYEIKRDDNQFLGSESKTELNIRVQANVGRFSGGIPLV